MAHNVIGRDLVGGSLMIKSKVIVDNNFNLYGQNLNLSGAATVNGNVLIKGDAIAYGTGQFGDGTDATGPCIILNGNGVVNTCTTLLGSQTVDRVLTLPDATDTLIGKETIDILTNKTIVDPTNNVTASALFSGSGTNTVDVREATNPTTGQILTATSATSATWQTPAVSGGAGSLGYAFFYGQAPGDYAVTIATGAPLPFPSTGPAGGASSIVRTGPGTFTLPDIGTYMITWQAGITEPGQLMLSTTNLGLIVSSVASRATGTSQISNTVFIETAVTNDVLSVINPPGNASALTVTPSDGNLTHACAPSLSIVRLA